MSKCLEAKVALNIYRNMCVGCHVWWYAVGYYSCVCLPMRGVVREFCGIYMGFEDEMYVLSFVGGAYAIMNTHTQRTEELSDISFTFCLIPMIK